MNFTTNEFLLFSIRSQFRLITKDGVLLMQVRSKTGCTRRLYRIYDFFVLVVDCCSGQKIIVTNGNNVPESILNEIDLKKMLCA